MNIPPLIPSIHLSRFHENRPERSERFLVEAGKTSFVVNRMLYDIILVLRDEQPQTLTELAAAVERRTGTRLTDAILENAVSRVLPRALFDPTVAAQQRTPFTVQTILLRSCTIIPWAQRLTWLFSPALLWAVAACFALSAVLTLPSAASVIHLTFTWREAAILYTAIFLSGLVHELGHATACHRHGCPPGDIGFGLYFIFPAFYADVTKAWRLGPRERALVDLGGLYFQAMIFIAVAATAYATGSTVAQRFLWITAFLMLHNLNPVFKLDGYWLLSDLSGLSNLHTRMRESFSARLQKLLGHALPAKEARVPASIFWAYLSVACVYSVYLVHFLVGALHTIATTYPSEAGDALTRAATALGAHEWLAALGAVAHLARISLWPLILGVALGSLLKRLLKFLFEAAKHQPSPPAAA